MGSGRRLIAVAKKEAREILRDPITLGIAIVLPLVMLFLFSYAITLDVKAIALAIVDEDRSPESREYVARFLRSDYFRLRAAPQQVRQVERLLDRGMVRVVLIIPADFSRALHQGLTVEVQTLVDGSFPNTAILALTYIDAITQAYEFELQERVLAARLGRLPRVSSAIQVASRVRYNPALRSEDFVIPGLFAVILMAFPPLLTALAIVQERERGSMQQIYTSPIRVTEFFWGKLIPYALIAFVEMLLLLVAALFWFHAPVRGSIPLLLGLSLLYVLSTVGIGLAVSTWTRSQVVALLLAIVLTFMPAFLFSGFLFAIASMPPAFQAYTYLFPARYFMDISRGIALKGVGMAHLWPQVVLLVVYAIGLFGLASVRFRKNIGGHMGPLAALITKEFIQFFRRKPLVILVIWTIAAEIAICAYAITYDVTHIAVVVQDLDGSPRSRELLDRFAQTPYFDVRYQTTTPYELDRLLETGRATLGLVIPPDFSRQLGQALPASVQLLVDGSNSNTALIALGYARRLIRAYARDISLRWVRRAGGALGPVPHVQHQPRTWYGPDLRSVHFVVVAMLVLGVMLIAILHPAAALAWEKEAGTIEQLLVMPFRAWELMLAKVVPTYVVSLGSLALALWVPWWFEVPIRGSLPLFFALSGLFLLSALGLGLLFGSLAENLQQALLLGFFAIFPLFVLSGTMVPIDSMPRPIQVLSYASPLRYYLEIGLGIFLKGVGMPVLWPQVVAMGGLGLGILALGLWRFRRQLR